MARTGLTVIFVTHNVREAVRRLGDRVILLSSRPGCIVEEYPIDIERPRRLDSFDVADLHGDHHRPLERGSPPPWPLTTASSSSFRPGSTHARGPDRSRVTRGRKVWRAAWPKLHAIAIFLAFWQFLIWIEWKPWFTYASPADTFQSLVDNWSIISEAMWTTLRRGIEGYAIAIVIGVAIGATVARIPVLRAHDGFDDHRAADHAVGGVVPARVAAVQAQREPRSSS